MARAAKRNKKRLIELRNKDLENKMSQFDPRFKPFWKLLNVML